MRLDALVTSMHVAAVAVWVGSVLAGFVAARIRSGDDATRHVIAQTIFAWLARPAFALALGLGAARLAMDLRFYFVTTHFMHAKLTLALVAIVAHHFLGARIRSRTTALAFRGPATTFAAALFGLTCLGAVVLMVARPM